MSDGMVKDYTAGVPTTWRSLFAKALANIGERASIIPGGRL